MPRKNVSIFQHEAFNEIHGKCIQRADKVSVKALKVYARGIAQYRNLIHEDATPMVISKGQMFIPRPDKLKKYRRWSALRKADPADLAPLTDVIQTEAEALLR